VGRTSTTISNLGVTIPSSGAIQATANFNALGLNRLSGNGDIAIFQKSGTTVGSIGVISSDNLFITGGVANHSGLALSQNSVLPMNGSSYSTGTVDLGSSGVSFKDLYLSGGVYLGGTGAANKLDDYEEGTWTPTITGSTSGSATLTINQASYTKVGRAVHVSCYIINANVTGLVGTITVGGLPFTANGFAMTKSGYSTLFSFDQQTIEVAGYTENGAAYIRLQKGSSITGITGTDATAAGDGRIMMNFTYQTS
jgi:hypothetical protein